MAIYNFIMDNKIVLSMGIHTYFQTYLRTYINTYISRLLIYKFIMDNKIVLSMVHGIRYL